MGYGHPRDLPTHPRVHFYGPPTSYWSGGGGRTSKPSTSYPRPGKGVNKARYISHYRVYVTVFPLHLAIAPRGSGERFSNVTTRVRSAEGLPASSDVSRYHTVSGLSSGPRAERLSGRRDRYGAAGSAPGRCGERPNQGRIRDSTRVCAGVGWMFEHPKAHKTTCGGRTVA